MKIIHQNSEEMQLKDGNTKSVVFGGIFIIIALATGFSAMFGSAVSSIWVSLLFLLAGALSVFASSSIFVSISKSNNQITYQKKRLIGGSATTHAISDVFRVETVSSWREVTRSAPQGRNGFSVSTPNQQLVVQSFIVMKDGTQLPLSHQGGSGFTMYSVVVGTGKDVAIASTVATFLGVPFQEITPPSAGTGINRGGIGTQI